MDFYYDFSYNGILEELGGAISTGEIAYNLVMVAMGIVGYILRAVALQSIARRRGITNGWLAWIPVAWVWVLGSISDQFRYVTKAQVKYKRVTLLVMYLITAVLCIAVLAIVGVNAVDLINLGMTGGTEEELTGMAISLAVKFLGMCLLLWGVALAASIICYIALYDLYISANPSNAVLFLILSIFFGSVQPFLIFFSRNKDNGMPPRCDVPQEPVSYAAEEPAWKPMSYIPEPLEEEPVEEASEE